MKHIILICLTVFCMLKIVNADDSLENKFIVKNIPVDEIADTSEKARNNAIKFAEKRAFETIIGKIFEDLGEGSYSPEQISNIVQAIEFRNEVITDNRYRAIVDVSFHPEQTQFFINNNFLNKPIKKLSILLIPTFNENGLVKLWQQSNIWFQSWKNVPSSEIVNYKIPLGDIDDMINFKIDTLNSLTEEQIVNLQNLYQVDKIVIADLIYRYQTIAEEVEFKAYLRELGKEDNSTLVSKSDGFKEDDYNKHMEYLAGKIVKSLESGWVDYHNSLDDANKQVFAIRIKNIDDWLDIKERLEGLEIVKNFKVDSFSARYARVTLEFYKKPIEILDVMKDLGFKISREDNYILLSTR